MTKSVGALIIIGVIIAVYFTPAITGFFTHDDFFHLRISQPGNIITSFQEFPHFRPLTTQAYYLVSAGFFSNSVQILRIISLSALLVIGYQVYLLARQLTDSPNISRISALLYLTSATHFAHLNYAGAFHELGMTVCILAGILCIWRRSGLSPLFFIMALLSKETAVVYPGLLFLISRYKPGLKINWPVHLLILAAYGVFRLSVFGFATGDSYQWILSPQIFNTLAWYLLWAFNLPEMLVDFVGPGLHINPNLIRFWGHPVFLIFSAFIITLLSIVYIWIRQTKNYRLSIFSGFWFIFSLGPLLLLPWHKFAFYLTLPLVGLCVWLGYLQSQAAPKISRVFIIFWILTSILTYSLTLKTHWISRGAATSLAFHNFFGANKLKYTFHTLVFYDNPEDKALPWLPSQVLKVALSDQNYFRIFAPGTKAVYLDRKPDKIDPDQIFISARQFLGY